MVGAGAVTRSKAIAGAETVIFRSNLNKLKFFQRCNWTDNLNFFNINAFCGQNKLVQNQELEHDENHTSGDKN